MSLLTNEIGDNESTDRSTNLDESTTNTKVTLLEFHSRTAAAFTGMLVMIIVVGMITWWFVNRRHRRKQQKMARLLSLTYGGCSCGAIREAVARVATEEQDLPLAKEANSRDSARIAPIVLHP